MICKKCTLYDEDDHRKIVQSIDLDQQSVYFESSYSGNGRIYIRCPECLTKYYLMQECDNPNFVIMEGI